jgi:hypothetical protein
MKELERLYRDINADAPMRIVNFDAFQKFGKLPRSSDKKTEEVTMIPAHAKLVFISHSWLRPNMDAQTAHPDDAAGSKHALVCAGIKKLAQQKGWSSQHVYLWLDFCCVEQDRGDLLKAGVASLKGYISVCDAVLIPSPEVPSQDSETAARGQWTE